MGIRSPDLPGHRESPYQLSYPGPDDEFEYEFDPERVVKRWLMTQTRSDVNTERKNSPHVTIHASHAVGSV
jgi:hypothetical protein